MIKSGKTGEEGSSDISKADSDKETATRPTPLKIGRFKLTELNSSDSASCLKKRGRIP